MAPVMVHKKIKAPETKHPSPAAESVREMVTVDPDARQRLKAVEERVAELEGDLYRIVDLLVRGDLEAAKFKEILAKRQGKA